MTEHLFLINLIDLENDVVEWGENFVLVKIWYPKFWNNGGKFSLSLLFTEISTKYVEHFSLSRSISSSQNFFDIFIPSFLFYPTTITQFYSTTSRANFWTKRRSCSTIVHVITPRHNRCLFSSIYMQIQIIIDVYWNG